jgi:hypothetical protein
MQRRTAVKRLLVLTTGAMLLPSCGRQSKELAIPLDHIKVSPDLNSLLSQVTETIIPTTETPGASELELSEFVLRMVDDCYGEEDQRAFEKGLSELDAYAEKSAGDSFADLSSSERQNVLLSLEKSISEQENKENLEALLRFYQLTKSLTIRGYMNSESVMTNLTYYKMIPGRFDGCVEIKAPTDYKTIFG